MERIHENTEALKRYKEDLNTGPRDRLRVRHLHKANWGFLDECAMNATITLNEWQHFNNLELSCHELLSLIRFTSK